MLHDSAPQMQIEGLEYIGRVTASLHISPRPIGSSPYTASVYLPISACMFLPFLLFPRYFLGFFNPPPHFTQIFFLETMDTNISM